MLTELLLYCFNQSIYYLIIKYSKFVVTCITSMKIKELKIKEIKIKINVI